MSLKLRFAVLITCLVAAILLTSFISIFLLFKSYRVDDHYARLKNRTEILTSEYKNIANENEITKNKSFTASLHMLQMILIKPPHKVIFTENDSIGLNITDELLSEIKRRKELRFTQGEYECIGMYNENLQIFSICGAIDSAGLKKLNRLFYILLVVFGGGVLISALLSFLMVQQTFKPLIRLKRQMQLTTSTNMATKVDEGKGKDELEQIAINFNAMLDRLNQGFEVQKSFVQHASHELRTPLATMLSQTEAALNRELTPKEYKQTLQSLQEEQIELIELTNSLLVLSQFENVNYRSNWLPQRVDEILYESITECNRLFSDIDIELTFENTPSQESELIIRGNEVLLKSAFRNLIKNAYLYSADKKVKIVINTSKDILAISFINRGDTLTRADIEKMYIPFYRGANAVVAKGFGLGLSIIKKIAEMHDAQLEYSINGIDINKFAISFQLKPMANYYEQHRNKSVPADFLYN